MPKFYCDYCDIYLAHSSIGGRRQHCIGRKHIQNKTDYYQRIVREQGLGIMPLIPGGVAPFAGPPPIFPGMHPSFAGGPPPFPPGIPQQVPGFMPPFNFPFGMPPPPPGLNPITGPGFAQFSRFNK